jgi:hypothetical protein
LAIKPAGGYPASPSAKNTPKNPPVIAAPEPIRRTAQSSTL